MSKNQKHLYDWILSKIRMGFEPMEDIAETAIESVEDEGWAEEITEEWIRQTIDSAYRAHLKASQAWQHPTDTERIRQVFDLLCEQKIIALHNAGVTKSDAISEVQHMWAELEEMGVQPIGYCYYHEQDLERVAGEEGGNLWIGFYGVEDDDEENALQVGQLVVEQLLKNGFKVKWNQTATSRIEVESVTWLKVYREEDEEKWSHDRVLELMKS